MYYEQLNAPPPSDAAVARNRAEPGGRRPFRCAPPHPRCIMARCIALGTFGSSARLGRLHTDTVPPSIDFLLIFHPSLPTATATPDIPTLQWRMAHGPKEGITGAQISDSFSLDSGRQRTRLFSTPGCGGDRKCRPWVDIYHFYPARKRLLVHLCDLAIDSRHF